ncbi:hypothetical protein LCGC14_1507200, partial [marine sediment metagenome]
MRIEHAVIALVLWMLVHVFYT